MIPLLVKAPVASAKHPVRSLALDSRPACACPQAGAELARRCLLFYSFFMLALFLAALSARTHQQTGLRL